MISLKLCRNALIRFFVVLVIISSFLNLPAYCQESEDSQVFISGFNAYQQKDYATTIKKMNEVLQKFPDTPLRDMVLFWLSRAYYKSGNLQNAARYMSQFSKEYPDNPLKGTVDEELLALTARYDKGEALPTGSLPVVAQRKEQEKAAQQQTESDHQTAAKADKERKAAEQAAIAKQAAEDAEQARLAAVQKDQERAAVVKAESDRKAAEKVELDRLAAAKADKERKAAEQAAIAKQAAEDAEQARLAVVQKDQERAAVIKAESDRKAAEQVELDRLAAAKAGEERKAADKTAQLKAESEKVDMKEVARQQAEMVRLAQAKAEQKRLSFIKADEEREAADKAAKAEQIRLMAAQAEKASRIAALEEKQMAALKAEADRVAAEKAAKLRLEQEKIEQQRKVAAAAESARLAAIRKEQERTAAAKAEAERLTREKAVLAKRAAVEAEQKKLARVKKEQERIAAERAEKERLAVAAAEASQRALPKPAPLPRQPEKAVIAVKVATPVPVKTAGQRQPPGHQAEEKARAARAAGLREKAVAQYKSILVTYPNTKAAAAAAAKLKELGVAVALPVQVAAGEPSTETSQVLRLEVAQFAGLEFNLPAPPQTCNVAQNVSIPFEIINQGNGSDSFYLESGFPAEFSAGFSSVAAPDHIINQTSVLAPGEAFKGLVHLTIPAASIDGLRIAYPIKASSHAMTEATQSREVRLIAAAPLLRATVKADRSNPLPGEKITYRVVVLNVGSTGAQDVTLRLNFPPQLEPVDFAASGFRQEMKAALVLDGLQLKSGESRAFDLKFQLKDGSLAGQELLTRAELQNNLLKTTSVFVSTAAYVQPQHGLLVQPGSERLVVIPGQKVSVPFVVTNSGNVREKFSIVSNGIAGQAATIFQDLNRDGVRQANEPVISEVGPLAAKEEASIVMEIATPRTASDGSEQSARITFRSEGDASRSYSAVTRLVYSRPVLQLAMTGRDGRLKPGEVASFDLTVTNHGSNLARVVELKSAWPEQLELVAADPATSSAGNGALLWKFRELGEGEKRVIKVSFRVKPGTGVGTNIQVKNILTYEDQIGGRY
ncbi:MAG: tetratricopeptide repeat protein [Geobacteraceae bacterium]|nr:tetratricopeptide repeat protein [Geobacteraceae bacterium]